MDLEAILARKPEFAIVDELAHSNAPGARHAKRYQDALLEARINVITALNIQHLESLNHIVKRLIGVTVDETVPDSFLARADEVVDVDVSVEELRERLRGGKIYPMEQVTLALQSSATNGNAILDSSRRTSTSKPRVSRMNLSGVARRKRRLRILLRERPTIILEIVLSCAKATMASTTSSDFSHTNSAAKSPAKFTVRDQNRQA